MRILLTGATGLIGRNLLPHLQLAGHEVVRLLRQAPGPASLASHPAIFPNLSADGPPDPLLSGFDAVIHLAGQNVDRRWTRKNRASILASRADFTRQLATALDGVSKPPAVFISASGIGYYGHDRQGQLLTEDSPAGQGFLADVCQQWEAASAPLASAGTRVVHMRMA